MPKHSLKNYYKCCLPEKPFRGSSTVWFILLFMKSTKIPTGGKLCLPCPIFAVPQLRSHGLQVLFLTPRFKTHTTEGKYSRQENHRDISLLPLIMSLTCIKLDLIFEKSSVEKSNKQQQQQKSGFLLRQQEICCKTENPITEVISQWKHCQETWRSEEFEAPACRAGNSQLSLNGIIGLVKETMWDFSRNWALMRDSQREETSSVLTLSTSHSVWKTGGNDKAE